MICYIPSKKRPNTKTHLLFEGAGIKVIHFLEPEDYQIYNVPNKINIKQTNKGISFVRNFMLDYAKKNNHKWVIFSDDDITAFGIYKGKTITRDANIWHEIYAKAQKLPFEIYGINYVQHAWHEKNTYNINRKYVEVCVLVNVEKIKWRYVEGMKQDRQFCMETIRNGYGVVKFNHFWFRCPTVGTNKGGLYDNYKNKEDYISAHRLIKAYYPYAKLNKKNNRIDAKLDVAGFAKSLNKIVK